MISIKNVLLGLEKVEKHENGRLKNKKKSERKYFKLNSINSHPKRFVI